MKYLKSCLIITMLLGVGYSECNESNWQDYYYSEGHNMEGCNLEGADLSGVFLQWATLDMQTLKGQTLRVQTLQEYISAKQIYQGQI